MSLVAAVPRCPGPCVLHHKACITTRVGSFFRIKASDEEACLVITSISADSLLWESRYRGNGAKLKFPQRRVNIPSLCRCNLVWCVCHDALPVWDPIIHRDWMGPRKEPVVSCNQSEILLGGDISSWYELRLLTLITELNDNSMRSAWTQDQFPASFPLCSFV